MKPALTYALAWCFAHAAIAPHALYAKRAPDVLVVGDLTEDGKKLNPPTPETPLYYVPIVAGFTERGATYAGEKAPDKNALLRTLAVQLARENYRVMNASHPPQVVLVIWWGTMNPEIDDFPGEGETSFQSFFNEREMLSLLGAYKEPTFTAPFGWKRDELLSAARENRYFIIVRAYDYEAAKQKQKKPLWTAKMSTASQGFWLDDVFPAMIASGGPVFGRDTRPTWVDPSKPAKRGKVELGPLEVKEYLPTPAKK